MEWYDDLSGLEEGTEGHVITSTGLLYWYSYKENYLDIMYINGAGLRSDMKRSANLLGINVVDIFIYPENMLESHIELCKIDDFNLN